MWFMYGLKEPKLLAYGCALYIIEVDKAFWG